MSKRSTRVPARTGGADPTQQQFKDESDINTITSRYIPGVPGSSGLRQSGAQPLFGDFSLSAESYHEFHNRVLEAQTVFASLPSRIRSRFQNNPYNLLKAIELGDQYPKVREELEELGLVNKRPVKADETPPTPPVKEGSGDGSIPLE